MKEKHLNSWSDFEDEIKNLESLQGARSANLYFRGQSNSSWKLETTWERHCNDKTKLIDYYKLILRVKDEIEVLIDRKWDIPNLTKYSDWLSTYMSIGGGAGLPGYDYMTYLRHYGFPSPLLDWSKSQYVAAFFAFHELNQKLERVAIFVYLEHITGYKGGRVNEPNIITCEKDVNSHKRHSLQQSSYSICTSSEREQAYYCCHEDVFSRGSIKHDYVWKFTLPYNEQIRVLEFLDARGINEYSLFGSEESLMKTEFLRKFVLK